MKTFLAKQSIIKLIFFYILTLTAALPLASALETTENQTPLMRAAAAGNDWEIRRLLKNGADINARDKDGWSALMYAIRYQNNFSIVKLLADNGAHLRVRNSANNTPLMIAAKHSENPDILQFLLSDRSGSEEEVFHSFIMAISDNASSEHVKEAKLSLFLKRNVPLNGIFKGKTPLMYACQLCISSYTAGILIKNGADGTIMDENGKKAFDYANENPNFPHDNIYWKLNS